MPYLAFGAGFWRDLYLVLRLRGGTTAHAPGSRRKRGKRRYSLVALTGERGGVGVFFSYKALIRD